MLICQHELRFCSASTCVNGAGQLRQNRSKADNIVEFFCLEQRISDAQQLMPFLEGGVRQQVARAVAAVSGDLTAVQQLVASLVAGLPAMITK